jgi:hypothetical protein
VKPSGGAYLTVTNAVFEENAGDATGTIDGYSATAYLSNTLVTGANRLAPVPGARNVLVSTLRVENSTFRNNSNGGVSGRFSIVVRNSQFIANDGTNCGGINADLNQGRVGALIEGNVFSGTRDFGGTPFCADVKVGTHIDAPTIPRHVIRNNTFVGEPDLLAIAIQSVPTISSVVEIDSNIISGYKLPIMRASYRPPGGPPGDTLTEIIANRSIISDAVRMFSDFNHYFAGGITYTQLISPTVDRLTTNDIREVDPRFASDGYHLSGTSPAIDAGADAGPSVDIDGQPRPQRARPDIGADEYYEALGPAALMLKCPPAINAFGEVTASINPSNTARPIVYTISGQNLVYPAGDDWPAQSLRVGLTRPGAQTVLITATNAYGSSSATCQVNVTRIATRSWLPIAARR